MVENYNSSRSKFWIFYKKKIIKVYIYTLLLTVGWVYKESIISQFLKNITIIIHIRIYRLVTGSFCRWVGGEWQSLLQLTQCAYVLIWPKMNWVSNFLIPIFLQPGGVNLWYFTVRLANVTERSPRFKSFGSSRNSLNPTLRPNLRPNSNDSLCHVIDSCKIFGST